MTTDVNSRLVITAEDRTSAAFRAVEQRADRMAAGFASAATALITAGAAAGGAMLLMAARGAKAGEELIKLSQAFNIPASKLANLQTAAELTGTSIEAIGKAALRLGGVVGDSLTGKTSDATAALQALGITQQQLAPIQNDTEAQLKLISERFSALPPGIQRSELAADLFGQKLATQLIPFLLEGAEATRQAEADLAAFGIELTDLDVARAEQLGDQFDRVRGLTRAMSIEMASTLAPVVTALLDTFADLAAEERGAGEDGLSAGKNIAIGFALALDAVDRIEDFITLVRIGFKQLQLEASELADRFDFIDNIPSVSPFIASLKVLRGGIEQSDESTGKLRDEIDGLFTGLEKDLNDPSLGSKFFDHFEKRLQEIPSIPVAVSEGLTGGAAAADKKALESFRNRIDKIIESTATEREILEQAFSDNFDTLVEADQKKIITHDQFNQVRLKLEEKFQADLAKITERENKPTEQLQKQLDDRLSALQAKQGTEVQQRQTAFELELAAFDAQFQAKLGQEDAYLQARALLISTSEAAIQKIKDDARLLEEEKEVEAKEKKLQQLAEITGIQQQTLADLFNFQNLGFSGQLGALASFGASFTGMLAGHSKKAFEINKKFAIAEAIISTLKGIDIALGSAPPPVNFVLAAAVAAKGFATVAQIKSTQPGGGGGSGGGGGASPSGSSLGGSGVGGSSIARADETQTGPTTVSIALHGRLFDRAAAIELMEQLNELASDRANMNFVVT